MEITLGKLSNLKYGSGIQGLQCAWRQEGSSKWFTAGTNMIIRGDNVVCQVRQFEGASFGLIRTYIPATMMTTINSSNKYLAVVLITLALAAAAYFVRNSKQMGLVESYPMYAQAQTNEPLLEDEKPTILGNGRTARFL